MMTKNCQKSSQFRIILSYSNAKYILFVETTSLQISVFDMSVKVRVTNHPPIATKNAFQALVE